MIIRIVRMTFQHESVDTFLDIFNQSKSHILGMSGCLSLELWRDLQEPNVFVTHSHWESEDALNKYRGTEFFKDIWGQTKALFTEKPIAFSVERVDTQIP